MQVTRAELEQRYREISDEELLQRMRDDLTALAREVALAEAGRRGLYLEALKVADRDAPVEVADHDVPIEVEPGHGPLKICARYVNPLDAQVLAACLQNAGLAARVMDADTIYANGALFYSMILGGARVMVPESQLDDALRIRAAFDAGEMAIDENFDVGKS